jgi:hypothetical protein
MLARRLILGRKCRTVRKPQLARSAQLSLSLSLSLSRQPQAVTNTRRILAASRQTLSRIAATASVGGLLILAYLAISPLWFIPTNNAHAAPTNPLKTTSAPSLSLSADKTAIALHLSPNNFGSDNFTITTTTENPTGYTTSISTNSPTETCLIRPSDITNSKTCSTATNTIASVSGSVDSAGTIAPSTLLTNQWGVSIASSFSANPSQDNVWFKIPDNSTPSIIQSSPTATSDTGETQTVTIGAKVDFTLPATTTGDEYQNTIVITAVANEGGYPEPTITNISPNNIGTTDGGQSIVIRGADNNTAFETAYQAFIDINNNGEQDAGEECADADISYYNAGYYNYYTITCNTPATTAANAGT